MEDKVAVQMLQELAMSADDIFGDDDIYFPVRAGPRDQLIDSDTVRGSPAHLPPR